MLARAGTHGSSRAAQLRDTSEELFVGHRLAVACEADGERGDVAGGGETWLYEGGDGEAATIALEPEEGAPPAPSGSGPWSAGLSRFLARHASLSLPLALLLSLSSASSLARNACNEIRNKKQR